MSYYGTVLNIGNLAGNVYLNFVLMVLVEFPAKGATILLLDRIGRKKLHIAFMVIGGIASTGTIFPILYGGEGKIRSLTRVLVTTQEAMNTSKF